MFPYDICKTFKNTCERLRLSGTIFFGKMVILKNKYEKYSFLFHKNKVTLLSSIFAILDDIPIVWKSFFQEAVTRRCSVKKAKKI